MANNHQLMDDDPIKALAQQKQLQDELHKQRVAQEKELQALRKKQQNKLSKEELEQVKQEIKLKEQSAAKLLKEEQAARSKESKQSLKDQEKALVSDLKAKSEQDRAYQKEQAELNARANAGYNAKEAVTDMVTKFLDELKGSFESTMNKFVETQEAMAYNLNGTEIGLDKVVRDLNSSLAGTGIVKQEAVYSNLTKLVESGILLDVESRAYLSTVAEDLGMAFSNQSKSLNRLINLQRDDLSDNRMAIEASLKTFLNQNYQTSLYIKEGFENVSNALIEAQSLVTSTEASRLEATVQKWMGSLSSLGMSDSTIDSLASAIGQVGSGNISALNGTAMQRLIVMGANQAGYNYGDLLINGLSAGESDKLISGIVQYIQKQIATADNNVVMSELARVFGLTVSDVVAASNLNVSGTEKAVIGDDINELLGKMNEYVYDSTQIKNGLENFLYNWATNTASDEGAYTAYMITNAVGSVVSTIANATGTTAGKIAAAVAKYAPILTTLKGLVNTIGDTATNLFGGGSTSATGIYESLMSGSKSLTTLTSGNNFQSTRGKSSSSTTVVSSGNAKDYMETSKSSATQSQTELLGEEAEEKSADDIYKLIQKPLSQDEKYLNTKDSAYTQVLGNIYTALGSIVSNTAVVEKPETSAGSTGVVNTEVTGVKAGENSTIIEDAIYLSAAGINSIYELLQAWYASNNNGKQFTKSTFNMKTMSTSENFSSWSASATGL